MIACIAGAILCSQSGAMHIVGPVGYAAQPQPVYAYYQGPPILQSSPGIIVIRRA